MAGILANKGGMDITFEYQQKTFSILNCHLVHSAKNFTKRNAMIAQLLQSFRYGIPELEPEVYSDFKVIMGDLNYRMAGTYESNIQQID